MTARLDHVALPITLDYGPCRSISVEEQVGGLPGSHDDSTAVLLGVVARLDLPSGLRGLLRSASGCSDGTLEARQLGLTDGPVRDFVEPLG